MVRQSYQVNRGRTIVNRCTVVIFLAVLLGGTGCGGGASDTGTASGSGSTAPAQATDSPSEGAASELKSYETAQLPTSWGEYQAAKPPTEKAGAAGSTAHYTKPDNDPIAVEFLNATIMPTNESFEATVASMNWKDPKTVNDHLVCTTTDEPVFCLAELNGGILLTQDANLVKNLDTFATMTEDLYQSLA